MILIRYSLYIPYTKTIIIVESVQQQFADYCLLCTLKAFEQYLCTMREFAS